MLSQRPMKILLRIHPCGQSKVVPTTGGAVFLRDKVASRRKQCHQARLEVVSLDWQLNLRVSR
jgi:hypothetical protein